MFSNSESWQPAQSIPNRSKTGIVWGNFRRTSSIFMSLWIIAALPAGMAHCTMRHASGKIEETERGRRRDLPDFPGELVEPQEPFRFLVQVVGQVLPIGRQQISRHPLRADPKVLGPPQGFPGDLFGGEQHAGEGAKGLSTAGERLAGNDP